MNVDQVLDRLRELAVPADREGMARFGINTDQALGVRIPKLRALSKEIGGDHALALELWASEVHEARLLAALVADPALLTPALMLSWAKDMDSWDISDIVCGNLFDRTPHALDLAHAWSERPETFVKRCGFVLMATLTVHDKKAADATFLELLPVCEREAHDERNFVKKAVNWAVRQIGKRNLALNAAAVATAERIREQGSKPARWIASDALRELRSDKVLTRLRKKGQHMA